MDEKPKSIWKKTLKGRLGLFGWFVLLAGSSFVAWVSVWLLSATSSIREVLSAALPSTVCVLAALILCAMLIRRTSRKDELSLWKKPLAGRRGYFLSFIIFACALFVVVFALELSSGSGSDKETLTVALVSSLSIAAAIVTLVAFIRWLCNWRNLKRVLFGFTCLVTLIALFYAEENWRAKRAWEKYKQAWEAKGEKFDLASILPPPVPDNQNFAMTPLWVEDICASMGMKNAITWYGDGVTALGHTNFVRPLQMPIEYWGRGTERFNSKSNWWKSDGNWRKSERYDLKLWQEYYRQLAAITNIFPLSSPPQSAAADVLLALSKFDSSIEKLRQAGRLPFSRFPIGYSDEDPSTILLPHLASIKSCSLTLRLRSVAELQAGQTEKALDDVNLTLRLIESIRQEPILISHLVRIAMLQILLQPIWEGLADHHWTDAQLTAIDAELGKLDFLADYQFSMRGERVFSLRIIDDIRRSRKFDILEVGGDHKSISDSKLLFPLWLAARYGPGGWYDQNKMAYCRINFDRLAPVVNHEAWTTSPVAQAQAISEISNIRRTRYNWVTSILLPALGSVPEKFTRAQSSVDLARIACALERYRLAYGTFPETLDTLRPQFLEKIPHDIIGGHPLKYHRTDDGQFVLYSIGWDEKDDGGTIILTKTGGLDYKLGDWVWRYPAK